MYWGIVVLKNVIVMWEMLRYYRPKIVFQYFYIFGSIYITFYTGQSTNTLIANAFPHH